jgi:hypothetical protein
VALSRDRRPELIALAVGSLLLALFLWGVSK